MATYLYDVPVIVKSYDDEDEELLPVKKDVVARLVADFNDSYLEQYCGEVKITHLLATPNGKTIRVKARTDAKNPTEKEREKIRAFINGQCSDGWNENGIELPAAYYGYLSHRYIIAYTWDRGFDVKSVRRPEQEQS